MDHLIDAFGKDRLVQGLGPADFEALYTKLADKHGLTTAGLRSYFKFYCHERPHQSLGNRTPAAVYHGSK